MKPARTCTVMLLFFTLSGLKPGAQNIPNANFDSIYIGGIDRVYHWVTSDALWFANDTVVPFPPDTYYPEHSGNHHFLTRTTWVNYFDTLPDHYLKSLVIYNLPELRYPDGTQFNSFICNGVHFYTDAQGFIDMSLGGSPFPYRPAYIKGNYRFSDSLSPGDVGRVETLLKRWNPATLSVDTIALATSVAELTPSATWKGFAIPFVYQDTALPDSIVVVISSSTFSTAPTTLFIDDIHFDFSTGVQDAGSPGQQKRAFPNPCSGTVFITPLPVKEMQYAILTIQGRVVGSGVSTDGTLSLSGLAPGPYVMLLVEDGITTRIKLIRTE